MVRLKNFWISSSEKENMIRDTSYAIAQGVVFLGTVQDRIRFVWLNMFSIGLN